MRKGLCDHVVGELVHAGRQKCVGRECVEYIDRFFDFLRGLGGLAEAVAAGPGGFRPVIETVEPHAGLLIHPQIGELVEPIATDEFELRDLPAFAGGNLVELLAGEPEKLHRLFHVVDDDLVAAFADMPEVG